jgi:hypothetical protein
MLLTGDDIDWLPRSVPETGSVRLKIWALLKRLQRLPAAEVELKIDWSAERASSRKARPQPRYSPVQFRLSNFHNIKIL